MYRRGEKHSEGHGLSRERLEVLPKVQPGCSRHRLAAGPYGEVQLCSCGAVHLHIGALTLRLPLEAVAELRSMLSLAEDRIETLREPTTPPPTSFGSGGAGGGANDSGPRN
jgi:hypothetical protein